MELATMAAKDITGTRIGNLVALYHTGWRRSAKCPARPIWMFSCDCGALYEAAVIDVRHPRHKKACPACRIPKPNPGSLTHGGSGTRLYNIWRGVRRRCLSASDKSYERYGGRGIKISPVWDEYPNFREWSLAHGYADDLQIDRIDNDGPYSPENCRWTTYTENLNNTSRNRFVSFRGQRFTIAQLSRKLGVLPATLRGRIISDWPESQWGVASKRRGCDGKTR